MKLQPKRIADLGRIVTGKTPPTHQEHNFGGDYMFVTPSDLNFKHYRCQQTERTVTDEAKSELPNQFIPASSVMFTCIGATIGKCGIAVDECLTNQQINSVIANDETDSTFLYYLLCHSVDIVKALGGGAATPIVSKSKFEEVQLLVPPLREQKAIASFLAAYDDLIENNHRRIALLEDAAKHLYREWFVYLLFPGYEHTATTNGVPDGWRQTQLGQMLTLKRGHDLPSAERVDGEIPIVSSSGITGFHNEKKATAPGVVTGRYGTIGEVYYVQQDYWPLNTALYVCDFKGNPPAYVAHLLKHVLAGTQSDKAAVPGVNRNVLHRIPILAPTKRLIDQFAEFAQSTYQKIYVLDTMNQKLSSARDLLLPRLMSGEIAV